MQTVLVTDMVDQNDDTIEILDQVVRASTPFPRCTQSGDNKCVASVTLPIGNDRQRLRVAVHVVKTTVGGAGIVTAANAKRRVLKWCRRIFAQANIAAKLLQVREVDPVENLICVSDAPETAPNNASPNAGGRRAAGDGILGFTINATGKTAQVVGPITPAANQDALTTATQLAALVQAPYTATVSPNPRRFNDALASCDILIAEASGAHVSISNLSSPMIPLRRSPSPPSIRSPMPINPGMARTSSSAPATSASCAKTMTPATIASTSSSSAPPPTAIAAKP